MVVAPGVRLPAHCTTTAEGKDQRSSRGGYSHYPLLQKACAGAPDLQALLEPEPDDYTDTEDDAYISDRAGAAAALRKAEALAAAERGEGDAPPLGFSQVAFFATQFNTYLTGGESPPWGVKLPGASDAPEARNSASPPGTLFHLDSKGNSCFTRAEGAAAAALLYETGFLQAVQGKLNGIPFQLPQARRPAAARRNNQASNTQHDNGGSRGGTEEAAARARKSAAHPMMSTCALLWVVPAGCVGCRLAALAFLLASVRAACCWDFFCWSLLRSIMSSAAPAVTGCAARRRWRRRSTAHSATVRPFVSRLILVATAAAQHFAPLCSHLLRCCLLLPAPLATPP